MRTLVATGSSGGHIFPALSFLESLKESDKKLETLLVLPKAGIKPKVLPKGCKVEYISIKPIRLNLNSKSLIALFKLLQGSLESLILLLKFKPDIVVGFGSIASLPMLFFAWVFRIKTLIHEQNVVPGRANRLLAKFVDKVAVSFAQTRDYLKIDPKRLAVTGNPIRRQLKRIEKKEALSFFGFSQNKFTVLVMGGSQGSHNINTAFLKAVSQIKNNGNLQVIHLAGEKDQALLRQGYNNLQVSLKLLAFLEDMQYAYNAADLAICRSGATTIAELINFQLPAIIIPYPFAYAHQLQNARILEKTGSAIVISDNDLGGGLLQRTLESLLQDTIKLDNMRLGFKNKAGIPAGVLLVREAVSLAAA